MTDDANDLAEFLLARIAEDEAVAREGGPELAEYGGGVGSELNYDSEYDDVTAQPARVLAECEAKRRIVEAEQRANRAGLALGMSALRDEGYGQGLYVALQLLALPYADHPDYREEWRV